MQGISKSKLLIGSRGQTGAPRLCLEIYKIQSSIFVDEEDLRRGSGMPQEIILTTSSASESLVLLHGLHTSNHIQSFRQSTTAANGLTVHPSKCQFLAAQVEKGIVHVYSWGKDTVNTKMILPEKIRALKISPSGTWCVGGSESGRLFLWEVFSRLVLLTD